MEGLGLQEPLCIQEETYMVVASSLRQGRGQRLDPETEVQPTHGQSHNGIVVDVRRLKKGLARDC